MGNSPLCNPKIALFLDPMPAASIQYFISISFPIHYFFMEKHIAITFRREKFYCPKYGKIDKKM